jgi:Transposase DDE domain
MAAGYCTDANLAAASPDGSVLLMPPYNTRKDRDAAKAREQLGNRAPKARSAKADMERRYASEEGQALYRLRCQTVEPAFGQIKRAVCGRSGRGNSVKICQASPPLRAGAAAAQWRAPWSIVRGGYCCHQGRVAGSLSTAGGCGERAAPGWRWPGG